jgi:hypothetical protein
LKDASAVWTDDLLNPYDRAFFSVCRTLSFEGEPLDPLLIAGRLAGTSLFPDRVAVAEYMADLEDAAINADATVAIKLIREASRKRQIRQTCEHALKATANGQASSTILNDLQSDLFDLQRACDVSSRFKAITAAELDSGEYDHSYLVKHVLVEGQPCVLAGPKKALKTTVLVDLGMSLATAKKFLGEFWIPTRKRFLLCSGESGIATLQETARRIAKSKGVQLANVADFTISPDLPRFDDPENLAEFERFLDDQAPDVLAVDPCYLCMPGGDAGNLFIQGVMLRRISELCQRLGITLVIAHHSKRHVQRDPYAAPELDDIAWAGFAEFARQWVLLGRREAYLAGSGDHRLWMSVGGSAGHGGLYAVDVAEGSKKDPDGRRYEVTVQSAKEARQDAAEREQATKQEKLAAHLEAERAILCRVFAKYPKGTTKTHVRDHCGISSRRFPTVFAAAIDAGDIVPCPVKVGNKKKPLEGYKLNPKEAT